MMIGETVRVAVDAMLANKLRSLLTMLGVIIGIAAVIATVALGEGAQRSIQERLQSLGTDVLTIRPGQSMFGGIDRGGAMLTVDDAEALLAAPEHIVAAAPEMQSNLQIELGNENANLSVVGTWASYFDLNNFSLSAGRFFTDDDDRGRRRVAVLGALVGSRLGTGRGSLVGEAVMLRGVRFEVIGVLQEKGSQGFQNPDEAVYIPLGTARYRILGTDRIRSISFQAQSEDNLPMALAEADAVLRREHRLRAGDEADFSIRDQTALLSTFQETTRSLSFLLAGIALISLIVGGIGIMNIMLVSVSERTREIGLRKALGARRADVLAQFLIEALVLCLGGGALGVGVGVGASFALQRFAGWNMSVSPQALVVAFAFAAVVGVFFGMWPARRAARLDPIEALRYE